MSATCVPLLFSPCCNLIRNAVACCGASCLCNTLLFVCMYDFCIYQPFFSTFNLAGDGMVYLSESLYPHFPFFFEPDISHMTASSLSDQSPDKLNDTPHFLFSPTHDRLLRL
jgi:hypothetical protein